MPCKQASKRTIFNILKFYGMDVFYATNELAFSFTDKINLFIDYWCRIPIRCIRYAYCSLITMLRNIKNISKIISWNLWFTVAVQNLFLPFSLVHSSFSSHPTELSFRFSIVDISQTVVAIAKSKNYMINTKFNNPTKKKLAMTNRMI